MRTPPLEESPRFEKIPAKKHHESKNRRLNEKMRKDKRRLK
jgi:hypothetical protein